MTIIRRYREYNINLIEILQNPAPGQLTGSGRALVLLVLRFGFANALQTQMQTRTQTQMHIADRRPRLEHIPSSPRPLSSRVSVSFCGVKVIFSTAVYARGSTNICDRHIVWTPTSTPDSILISPLSAAPSQE